MMGLTLNSRKAWIGSLAEITEIMLNNIQSMKKIDPLKQLGGFQPFLDECTLGEPFMIFFQETLIPRKR